jgi:hypothetical protein
MENPEKLDHQDHPEEVLENQLLVMEKKENRVKQADLADEVNRENLAQPVHQAHQAHQEETVEMEKMVLLLHCLMAPSLLV